MIATTKLPPFVLTALRKREGVAPDDATADHTIAALDGPTAFREFCAWHGFGGWADTLRMAMDACAAAEVADGGTDAPERWTATGSPKGQ